ncbi:hypothetical protein B4U79_17496 [Dinothrombium tinctorium]|uniref:Protein kinase domain-containing protein n=1 Tax=Dinothrombium tinctorium TaxID=1965070 RepID=A0A3S3SBM8_9ACAR|nr:hypothetical protein B4U79_17496 [Dinothrombium tinctorium]
MRKQQQSNPEPRIFTDYNVIECIGCGVNGPVFKAQHRIDKRQYAIKRIEYPLNRDDQNKLLGEVRKLATFDQRNVVRYHNSWFDNLNKEDNEKLNLLCNQTPSVEKNDTIVSRNNNLSSKYLFIATELCNSFTLKQWLSDGADRHGSSIMLKLLHHTVKAVNNFHNNGGVHNEIKIND